MTDDDVDDGRGLRRRSRRRRDGRRRAGRRRRAVVGRRRRPVAHADEPQGAARTARGPVRSAIQRLYRGETQFDFVGRRRMWFTISTVIIVAGIISIILRGGLNLGIEFKGGTEWTVKAPHVTQTQAVNAMQAAGLVDPIVQLLGQGSNQQLNVQADLNKLSAGGSEGRDAQGRAGPGQADPHLAGERRRTASRRSARPGARPSPTRPSRP